jgi:hypothetical protein
MSSTSITTPSEAFSLANEALGRAMGLSTRGVLRAGQQLADLREADYRSLLDAVRQHVARTRDPITGRVSFGQATQVSAAQVLDPLRSAWFGQVEDARAVLRKAFDHLANDGAQDECTRADLRVIVQVAEVELQTLVDAIADESPQRHIHALIDGLVDGGGPLDSARKASKRACGSSRQAELARMQIDDGIARLRALRSAVKPQPPKDLAFSGLRRLIERYDRGLQEALADVQELRRVLRLTDEDLDRWPINFSSAGERVGDTLRRVARTWGRLKSLAEVAGRAQRGQISHRLEDLKTLGCVLKGVIDHPAPGGLGCDPETSQRLQCEIARLGSRLLGFVDEARRLGLGSGLGGSIAKQAVSALSKQGNEAGRPHQPADPAVPPKEAEKLDDKGQ